jgi:phosphoribosylglycinamide formyltransferase 1
MTVGIITYNYKHLKTSQVLERLSKNKCDETEYTVFALPYTPYKSRQVLFEHRPKQDVGEHTRDIAARYSMRYVICERDKEICGCDYYLVCGAGILSPECVKGKKIINCHPGIIPIVRGLDAFKWAIYNQQQVGNTLYIITEEVDLAEMGLVSVTPVYKNDMLQTFADRHYSREIEMLVNYNINKPLKRLLSKSLSELKKNFNEVNHRMSIDMEAQLNERFNHYKYAYAKKVDEG